MRQLQDDPNSFHPLKPESQELMKAIIDQILSLHQGSEYVHLGAGEVNK